MRFFWPVAAACAMGSLGDPRAHVAAFVTLAVAGGFFAWRAGASPSVRGVVVAAVLVRLPLLHLAPTLSDDVWRYVWEGRVWAHGFSPFQYAPDAPELTALRDDAWALVNHREVSSIYPPAAQLLFVLLHAGGVPAFRVAASAADVVTAALLARRSLRAGTLWALLPLPAMEAAVSGHLESFGVCALVAGLGGSELAAWVGAMVKLLPGVLLVRSRRPWVWALATAAATAPLVGPGFTRGFGTYEATWSYNGSVFPLLRLVLGDSGARLPLEVVGAAIVGGILLRSRDPGRIALWTCGAFVLLAPTVHPWYALWVLAAALWAGVDAWVVLAGLLPLAYVVLASLDAGGWVEPVWPRFVYYPVFYGLLVREGWVRLSRPGPWPVH